MPINVQYAPSPLLAGRMAYFTGRQRSQRSLEAEQRKIQEQMRREGVALDNLLRGQEFTREMTSRGQEFDLLKMQLVQDFQTQQAADDYLRQKNYLGLQQDFQRDMYDRQTDVGRENLMLQDYLSQQEAQRGQQYALQRMGAQAWYGEQAAQADFGRQAAFAQMGQQFQTERDVYSFQQELEKLGIVQDFQVEQAQLAFNDRINAMREQEWAAYRAEMRAKGYKAQETKDLFRQIDNNPSLSPEMKNRAKLLHTIEKQYSPTATRFMMQDLWQDEKEISFAEQVQQQVYTHPNIPGGFFTQDPKGGVRWNKLEQPKPVEPPQFPIDFRSFSSAIKNNMDFEGGTYDEALRRALQEMSIYQMFTGGSGQQTMDPRSMEIAAFQQTASPVVQKAIQLNAGDPLAAERFINNLPISDDEKDRVKYEVLRYIKLKAR